MNPSQFAATTILPFLARVVLALAFLPQGWNNLMVDTEYTGTDAQRLREMGVRSSDREIVQPDVSLGAVRGSDAAWPGADADWAEPSTVRADQVDPATDTPARATPPVPRPAQPDTPARTTAPRGPDAAPVLTAPRAEQLSPLAPMAQRGLYQLALYADAVRLPFPIALAWGVAAVQFFGGGFVLLGLLSRVWGLLMAVIVVGVFVTGTIPRVQGVWFFDMPPADSNLVFAQIGLFVLALGVFMVGPGALSLDRAVFRRGRVARKAAPRSA